MLVVDAAGAEAATKVTTPVQSSKEETKVGASAVQTLNQTRHELPTHTPNETADLSFIDQSQRRSRLAGASQLQRLDELARAQAQGARRNVYSNNLQ